MGAANRKDLGRGRRPHIDGKIRQSYSGINNFAHVGRGLQGTSAGNAGVASGTGVTFPLTPTIIDVSPGATINIDLSAVTAHHTKITLTENLTITLSNPPASGSRIQSTLEFIQDATGGWTVTFPGSVTTPPTVPATANERTVYVIQTIDNGTSYDIFESLITNTVAGSGATTALDNLATTNINANLLPQAAKTLGSGSAYWSKTFTSKLDLDTAGTILGGDAAIIADANGPIINGPTTIQAKINGTAVGNWATGGLTIQDTLTTKHITLGIENAPPAINGRVSSDGTDVRIYSGGALRNITNIPTGTALNTDLSNLAATTNLNSNLLPQSGKTLGGGSNYWSKLFSNKLDIGTGGTMAAGDAGVIADANGLIVNSVTTISYKIGNTTVGNWAAGGLTLQDTLTTKHVTMGIENAPPAINGRMSSDGTDVRVYSGGSLRNLSNIGAAGGADVNLSNLTSPTSVNQHILPQAGKTLGDGSNYWSKLFSNKIDIGVGGTLGVTDNGLIATANGITIGVPSGDFITWTVAGSTKGILNTNGISSVADVSTDQLTLAVNATAPTIAGVFTADGTDVFVYSGGSVRNLSDVSAGGGGADTALSNLASVAINTSLLPATDDAIDLGSGTKQWKDLYVDGTAHIDTLNATVISGTISVTGTSFSITSGTIILGDSTADNINIIGRIDSDIIPDSNGASDLGSSSLQWQDLYITGTANLDTITGVGAMNTSLLPTDDTYNIGGNSNRWHEMYVNDFLDVLENYTSGTSPSGQTDRARIFSVNNGIKTQVRIKFQSGTSVLIAEEP